MIDRHQIPGSTTLPDATTILARLAEIAHERRMLRLMLRLTRQMQAGKKPSLNEKRVQKCKK